MLLTYLTNSKNKKDAKTHEGDARHATVIIDQAIRRRALRFIFL